MKKLFFIIVLLFFSINFSEASFVDDSGNYARNILNKIAQAGKEALKKLLNR